jgi:tetratricopeptide (TPR) repeat protein
MGQLQHPGIPPVYDLGELPDGRPFFALKLIQGRTLAELLHERPHPAHDLARWVALFGQVCQTVAYAHSRGILHRDLKPANVMVGAFGEVQVMDWGLAKVLGSTRAPQTTPPTQELSTIYTARTSGDEPSTQAGTVMGTLAYMAPEQARGEVDELDERCDVFGLGAVLCVLLTGQPPYIAPRDQLPRQAAHGQLADAFARLDACVADAELVRLAKACLAAEREERPRHAGGVAEAVAAYQARVQERLRQAEVAHAQAQVKIAEERKRRRVTLALAVAVCLLLGSGGVAGWWYQSQQADRARKQALNEQAVRQSLDQAQDGHDKLLADLTKPGGVQALLNQPARWELQLQTARADWQRAKALAASAESGLDPGLSDRLQKLEQQLARDQADYQLALRLEKIRLDRAAGVGGKFDNAKAVREYQQAFQEAGLSLEPGRQNDTAQQIGQSAIKEQLLAALDNWALVVHKLNDPDLCRQILKVARLADPDPWRDRVRDGERWNDPKAFGTLAGEVERDQAFLARLSPQMLYLVANLLPEPNKVVWLRLGQGLHPTDFWFNFQLAAALNNTKKQWSESPGFFRVALAIRPNSAAAWDNLGRALFNQRDLEGAIAALKKALDLDPKSTRVWNNLGSALREKKDLDGALAAHKKALDLDPKLALTWDNLGSTLRVKNDLPAALAAHQKALDLDPKSTEAWNNLGRALRAQKDLKGALAACQKAVALDPKNAGAWNSLGVLLDNDKRDYDGAIEAFQKALALNPRYAEAWRNLGIARSNKNDLDGAAAAYQKALDLDPKLAKELAKGWNNLGADLDAKKDLDGAIAAYQKALELDPKLALLHYNLGRTLGQKRDLDGALAAYQKALDLDPKFTQAWDNLGIALRDKKDLPGALAAYRKALALDPKRPGVWARLGIALHEQKNLTGAIDACRKALALDPKLPPVWELLGIALHERKDLAGAIAAFHKALELDPKSAETWYNLGNARRDKKDLAGAISAYQKALDLDPKYVLAWAGLGNARRDKKDLAGAIAAYQKVLALDPKLAGAWNNLGGALAEQKDLKGAIAAYQKALDLDPKNAPAHYNLGLALQTQGDLAGAVACFRKALELDPNNATAHYDLGRELHVKGDVTGAIVCYQKALELDPKLAKAHCNLGHALREQGHFAPALQALKRGHQLGSKLPNWHYPSAQWVADCQRLLDLDTRLSALLKGEDQPRDTTEQLALADLCQRYKKRYVAAARFYTDAFAAGAARSSQRTYNASCAAILAAAGKGEDAAKLDAKEKSRLRQQAFAWLKNALKILDKLVEDPERRDEVRQKLQHWQRNADLASVRRKEALAQLPEAERAAWEQLWADVEKLLKKGTS